MTTSFYHEGVKDMTKKREPFMETMEDTCRDAVSVYAGHTDTVIGFHQSPLHGDMEIYTEFDKDKLDQLITTLQKAREVME